MTKLEFENDYKKLAVIGYPIAHSLSPAIHNFIINSLNLQYIYLPFEIKDREFKHVLKSAKTLNIKGFNITMPYKEPAFLHMDKVFGDAQIAKSVNTVKLNNNIWEGYSTDGDGFNLSLEERGLSFKDKNVMLIGAGGASRALVINAIKNKANSVTVLNRNIQKAYEITKEFDNTSVYEFTKSQIEDNFIKNDIIINCTPLGMAGINKNFEDFNFLNTEQKILCDLIYSPNETLLLQKAKQLGHTTMNGLDMLIYQAILAFEIFTDEVIDKKTMKNAIRDFL